MCQFSSCPSDVRTPGEAIAASPPSKTTTPAKYALDTDETQVHIVEPDPPTPIADKVLSEDSPSLKSVLGEIEPSSEAWPEWWKVPLDSVVTGVSSLHLIRPADVCTLSDISCSKILGTANCILDFQPYSKAAACSLATAQGRGQGKEEQEQG